MAMLPKQDRWFLDMTDDEVRRVIPLGHCKAGPDCGCWWNRRLASALQSVATISAAAMGGLR